MIVTMASSGPRVWSEAVMGGKSDGVSGPGVGTAANEVQGAEVAPAILVTVGFGSGDCAVCVAGDVHDESKIKTMAAVMRFLVGLCIGLLMDCFQELVKGSHP